MSRLLTLILASLVACKAHTAPAPPVAAPDPALAPDASSATISTTLTDPLTLPGMSPSRAALYQAFSQRDGSPPCPELDPLSPDPASDYAWLTENVGNPPWVAMRAGTCLVTGHAVAALPTLQRWVTDPTLRGMGWLVLGNLDQMPQDVALHLALLALTDGPDPEGAARRILRARDPQIRALAE